MTLHKRLVLAAWSAVAFGGLILGAMAYAAWLTSDWGVVLACTPAILVTMAVVVGMMIQALLRGGPDIVAKRQPVVQRVPRQAERLHWWIPGWARLGTLHFLWGGIKH